MWRQLEKGQWCLALGDQSQIGAVCWRWEPWSFEPVLMEWQSQCRQMTLCMPWSACPGPRWGLGSRRTPGDAAASIRILSAFLFPWPVTCFQGVWAHLDWPHVSFSLFISWEDMRTKSLLPGQPHHAGEDALPGNSCSKSSCSSLKSYCA